MILGLPRVFWFLFAGMFINRLGSFIMAFLPLYLTEARGMSVPRAGLIVSISGIGALVAAQIGGAMSDRWGRRPTMLIGTSGGALLMLVLGLARSPVEIGAAAFLLGCIDFYRPASSAAVADLVPEEERTRAYGYIYWAVNLGFSAASALAGVLSRHGYFLLFAGDALTTVGFFAILFFFVPETRPASAAVDARAGDAFAPWRDARFRSFALAQGIVLIMFYESMASLALDMGSHGLGPEIFGRTLALNGVAIVLLQPLILRATRRVPNTRMLVAAALVSGLGLGMQAFARSEGDYIVAVCVWTLGEIAFSAAAPALVAELAPTHARGAYQGAYATLWGFAAVIAPFLGTTVLAAYGGRTLWLGSAAACVLAALLHALRR